MKGVTVLFFAALALASASALCNRKFLDSEDKKWEKPEFCHNSECPPFSVDDKTDTYEVRTYDSGRWAVVNVTDTKYELAYTKAAAKLMRYFKGANSDQVSLEMTVPTMAMLKLDKDSTGSERDYTFSMWLGPDFQEKDDIPEPNDEEVEIMKFPETTGFVRSFGGFATESTILREANALHEELTKDKEDFEPDYVFVAVYDPAVKLLNRHNEVHVLKKGEAPSASAAIASF